MFLLFCWLAEADLQHLSHALKVLSETEKQLRTSKNQTTWLTVALLQLNSGGSTIDANETALCRSTVHTRGMNGTAYFGILASFDIIEVNKSS